MVIIEAPETLSIAIIITIDNHYNNFLQGINQAHTSTEQFDSDQVGYVILFVG